MSPELAQLAAQIAASPDDIELQRIFADALIQAGGEHAIRGELIQLELAGMWGPRAMELADRLRDAREARGLGLGREGLARKWICSVGDLATLAATAFAEEPLLQWLVVSMRPDSDAQREMHELAAIPELARIRTLYVSGNERRGTRPGAEGIATLLASPHWPHQLESLQLTTCALRDDGAAVLARSTCLAELQGLDVSDNAIGADGVIALARSPVFAKLRRLHLSDNRPGQRGVEALAAADNRMQLALLDLHRTGLTREHIEPLQRRFPGIQIRYEIPETTSGDEGDNDDFFKGPFV